MNDVSAWLADRRQRSDLRVTPATLSGCSQWKLVDGELRHRTGRYFQVVGARALTDAGETWEQPMIRQEEIGLLGFLVRSCESGYEWLAQAKTEPGNVRGTQLGPTVQATESNFQRVHGGAPTRWLEWFDGGSVAERRYEVLGSEHGSRFLRKRNRNALVLVAHRRAPAAVEGWRWTSSAELRPLLARDFSVNTDARSVIVSSPWTYIAAGGSPFSGWTGHSGFGQRLLRSYRADPNVGQILGQLRLARASAPAGASEVALPELDAWIVDERGVRPREGSGIAIRHVRVSARDREVPEWCQPLLSTGRVTSCDLVCQERDGVLHFLLRAVWEPGLVERVELGASRESPATADLPLAPGECVRLSVLQSDEGGRFLRCATRYRVIERAAASAEPPAAGEHWVTLAQLERLASLPGALNNEARSAVSVLLSLA